MDVFGVSCSIFVGALTQAFYTFCLLQLELAYINTSHPDFIGGSRAIAEVMERNRTPNGGGGGSGAEVRRTPVAKEKLS